MGSVVMDNFVLNLKALRQKPEGFFYICIKSEYQVEMFLNGYPGLFIKKQKIGRVSK